MKKRIILSLGAALLTLGIGTAVYAADGYTEGIRDMLPLMKAMHPQMTDQQVQTMVQHHEQMAGGGHMDMPNASRMQNMMQFSSSSN